MAANPVMPMGDACVTFGPDVCLDPLSPAVLVYDDSHADENIDDAMDVAFADVRRVKVVWLGRRKLTGGACVRILVEDAPLEDATPEPAAD